MWEVAIRGTILEVEIWGGGGVKNMESVNYG